MGSGKDRPGRDAPDLEGLAKRFQDLWQSQLAATAADPEFMEMMGKWMEAFAAGGSRPPGLPAGGVAGPMEPAAWMAAMQQALAGAGAAGRGRANDASAGARPPKAGAKAAAAASGTGDVAGDELERRLADLEQRVGRLEAGPGGKGKVASARTRRRKS
ncbi:MAG: hypothetical protein OEN55_13030 [Alphaproteobacteria bacterium]|nr:hypothetical protein [Alphaproteobacteria bacterium]